MVKTFGKNERVHQNKLCIVSQGEYTKSSENVHCIGFAKNPNQPKHISQVILCCLFQIESFPVDQDGV